MTRTVTMSRRVLLNTQNSQLSRCQMVRGSTAHSAQTDYNRIEDFGFARVPPLSYERIVPGELG